MTPAQRTTGAHRDKVARAICGQPYPSVNVRPHIRRAVREAGEKPARSRRCKGDAHRRRRHWPAGWEGGGEGAPSQKTCRPPRIRSPRGRRKRATTSYPCFPRSRSPRRVAVRGAGARGPRATCGWRASARRSTAPPSRLLTPVTGSFRTPGPARRGDTDRPDTVRRSRAREPNGASSSTTQSVLLRALTSSQIGRYPAYGSSGWVYKVNGVSPPVGANAYALKEGDEVLWYFARFGAQGGPRRSTSCAGRAGASGPCSGTTTGTEPRLGRRLRRTAGASVPATGSLPEWTRGAAFARRKTVRSDPRSIGPRSS